MPASKELKLSKLFISHFIRTKIDLHLFFLSFLSVSFLRCLPIEILRRANSSCSSHQCKLALLQVEPAARARLHDRRLQETELDKPGVGQSTEVP